ncbi:diguanylate cyclase/phosphodiesterase with PAS/PAC sensor(s) [Hippea maritima DSM 10411]|uniref:Diguanylate cyclase/phosphodiesterase with PAS/PAC sensor(S) n=2 Tax=Hippea TaxID=84404 RepID=F2LXF4_HIPMA|nr:diguanylate cyclase/phosphodiesterase with PAS/PAC sensor(s) [Hippea maritima DSM 10411]
MLGYSKKDIIGMSIKEIIHQDDKKILNYLTKQTFASSGDYIVVKLKTKRGEFKKAILHISKIATPQTYIIATGKDITQNTELQRIIENTLKRDPLTNLLNRYAFIDASEEYLERAKYQDKLSSIIVIKPIKFSQINEVMGFENGNKILIEISNRIKNFLRKYDLVAKLESSKFAVLLKDIAREEDIFVISIDLIKELARPYYVNNRKLNISFNIGISMFPIDSNDAKDLLEKAEIALIDARLKGENAIGFYKENLKSETERKLQINQDFPEALSNKEFKLYFQPYFDIESKRIVGAEVLVRWIKNGVTIPPSEFIPVLEQTRNIVKLEDYVIKETIAFIEEFKNKLNLIPLSVNLSPTSLMDDDFIDKLISMAGKLSQFINIEITERLFLDKLNKAKSLLKKLRAKGFRIYIDDFGTGYSSLSYLSSLPIDCIKIDISFVKKILEDEKTKAIVKTIIYLAKQLNLFTIAEGIETEKHLTALKEMGCQIAQGFLLSKPLPKEDFLNLLKNH